MGGKPTASTPHSMGGGGELITRDPSPTLRSDIECTLNRGQGTALQPGVISCHLLLPPPTTSYTMVRQKQGLREDKRRLQLSMTLGLVFPT